MCKIHLFRILDIFTGKLVTPPMSLYFQNWSQELTTCVFCTQSKFQWKKIELLLVRKSCTSYRSASAGKITRDSAFWKGGVRNMAVAPGIFHEIYKCVELWNIQGIFHEKMWISVVLQRIESLCLLDSRVRGRMSIVRVKHSSKKRKWDFFCCCWERGLVELLWQIGCYCDLLRSFLV